MLPLLRNSRCPDIQVRRGVPWQGCGEYVPGEPECMLLVEPMPPISGLKLVHHPIAAIVQIPVILITGQANVRVAARAMHGGVLELIEKPIDPRSRDSLRPLRFEAGRSNKGSQRRSASCEILDTSDHARYSLDPATISDLE